MSSILKQLKTSPRDVRQQFPDPEHQQHRKGGETKGVSTAMAGFHLGGFQAAAQEAGSQLQVEQRTQSRQSKRPKELPLTEQKTRKRVWETRGESPVS